MTINENDKTNGNKIHGMNNEQLTHKYTPSLDWFAHQSLITHHSTWLFCKDYGWLITERRNNHTRYPQQANTTRHFMQIYKQFYQLKLTYAHAYFSKVSSSHTTCTPSWKCNKHFVQRTVPIQLIMVITLLFNVIISQGLKKGHHIFIINRSIPTSAIIDWSKISCHFC